MVFVGSASHERSPIRINIYVSRVKWTGSDPRIGISNSSVRVLRHPFWRRNLEDLQELQFSGAVEHFLFLRDPYSVNADIHVCGYFGPKGP